MWHSNGFSFRWTVLTWTFKAHKATKYVPQSLHSNSFTFLWIDLTWAVRSPFLTNIFWQISHLYGFSFSCTDLMCLYKFVFLVKTFDMFHTRCLPFLSWSYKVKQSIMIWIFGSCFTNTGTAKQKHCFSSETLWTFFLVFEKKDFKIKQC